MISILPESRRLELRKALVPALAEGKLGIVAAITTIPEYKLRDLAMSNDLTVLTEPEWMLLEMNSSE